jgi:hypothetical protein
LGTLPRKHIECGDCPLIAHSLAHSRLLPLSPPVAPMIFFFGFSLPLPNKRREVVP